MINSSSNFKEEEFGRDKGPSINFTFDNSNPFQGRNFDSSFPEQATIPANNNIKKVRYRNGSHIDLINSVKSTRQLTTPLQIDIILQSGHSEERELIKNVEFEKDHMGNIKLAPIIEHIQQMGFPVKDNLISYFSANENVFVFVGKEPLKAETVISIEDVDLNQRLVVKCRPHSSISPPINEQKKQAVALGQYVKHQEEDDQDPQSHSSNYISEQKQTPSQQELTIAQATRQSQRQAAKKQTGEEEEKEPASKGGNTEGGPSAKRTKERTIQDIIEKVSLWRKLYNGVQDNSGNLLRYSLEDAAQKVGVSKKSLDDYLLQLRFGKKFGFDFQKYKDDKVGVLRSYVKKEKTKFKGNKGAGKVSSKDSDVSE